MLGQQANIAGGNAILGDIFGSKDVSRNVASAASAETGIGSDVLKKMLPMLAGVAIGTLSKQTGGGNLVNPGDTLSSNDPMDMLSGLLDSGDDRAPIDDILNLAKKFL
jgi:hypothetical protein